MRYFMVSIFIVLLTACGPNSGSDSSDSLRVSLFTNGSNVAVNSQLVLVFSEALNSSTVNTSSIFITDSEGSVYPTSIIHSLDTVTIVPQIYFSTSTTYTVTVTTAVKNLSGQSLLQNFTDTFVTDSVSTGDTDGPTIVTSLPKEASNTFQQDGEIVFQFSENISPISVDASTVSLYNVSLQKFLNGTVRVSGINLFFKPDENLTGNIDSYEINVSNISDFSGNTANSSINFNINVTNLSVEPSVVYNVPIHTLNTLPYVIKRDVNTVLVGSVGGLQIVNFNLPSKTFTSLSSLPSALLGTVYSMDINTTTKRAYLGTSEGLKVVDYTNANNPQLLGEFPTNFPVYGLHVYKNSTFLAASLAGMIEVDTSNPANISLIRTTGTQGASFDVLVNPDGFGGYEVFVANYEKGVEKYDSAGTLLEQDECGLGVARQFSRQKTSTGSYLVACGAGGEGQFDPVTTLAVDTDAFQTTSSYVHGAKLINSGGIDLALFNNYKTGINRYDTFGPIDAKGRMVSYDQINDFVDYNDTTILYITNDGLIKSLEFVPLS